MNIREKKFRKVKFMKGVSMKENKKKKTHQNPALKKKVRRTTAI